jgi:hypothetical protein
LDDAVGSVVEQVVRAGSRVGKVEIEEADGAR